MATLNGFNSPHSETCAVSHEPRLIGDILTEYFSTSDDALAVCPRARIQKGGAL